MLPRPNPEHRDNGDDRRLQVAPPVINQAAELLGIGRSTVYELIDAGELISVKRGASRRIPLKAIYGYIDLLLEDAKDDGGEGPTVPSAS